MQPMGRKPTKFPSKTDGHYRTNGERVMNWWEVEGCDANKVAARQKAKRELKQYIPDEDAA